MTKATARAGSNIAFIKYWGTRRDRPELALPLNPSISMTLREARTTTTVAFDPDAAEDYCTLNGSAATTEELKRIQRVLGAVRRMAGIRASARVVSSNNFPTSAGIASSASGFAALALAAARAASLPCEPQDLAGLAILGSGSACRSLYGGYVLWEPPLPSREDPSVRQLASESDWPLVDLVAIVSREEKPVKSSLGHILAWTSPFLEARLASLRTAVPKVEKAVLERDFEALGEAMEADALSMHAVMMTSRPALLYWEPATVGVMKRVRVLREAGGLACYFTIDAGPNVHVITLPGLAPVVAQEIQNLEGVQEVLVCTTGEGAGLTEDHLF